MVLLLSKQLLQQKYHLTIIYHLLTGTTIDDVEDLDLVMPMDNVIKYSSNYSETTESLSLCSKDETSDFNNDIANTDNCKSFEYKSSY